MILADTSAWVDFLRGTGSAAHLELREHLSSGRSVAFTDPVAMELLAGAADDIQRTRIRRMLAGAELLPVGGLDTWEAAAGLYVRCRARGETVRSLVDCLIAAVAIREDVAVLHRDRDFDAIARHTPLRTA